jgi:hypothetical protein
VFVPDEGFAGDGLAISLKMASFRKPKNLVELRRAEVIEMPGPPNDVED